MAGESDITQNTLLICKGQELTMSPTQGQADNIERTIPYQPFRSPQGDSCMAGYLCLMPTAFPISKRGSKMIAYGISSLATQHKSNGLTSFHSVAIQYII